MATPMKPHMKLDDNQQPDTPETMSPKSTSSSPETISGEFLEFEGTTTFAPPPSPTYRYSMSLKSGKLRIWLEDCESKKHWRSASLGIEDYVDSANSILNATAEDYVEYFHELFNDPHDDPESFPVTFQCCEGDTFRLEVTVKIQVLQKSRVGKYTIDMEPISLERIDVLEAKMRDLEEKVGALCQKKEETTSLNAKKESDDQQAKVKLQNDKRDAEIAELKKDVKALRVTQDGVVSSQLQASAKAGDWIAWGNYANGVVQVAVRGTYQVTVVVNHRATTQLRVFNFSKGQLVFRRPFAAPLQVPVPRVHHSRGDQLRDRCQMPREPGRNQLPHTYSPRTIVGVQNPCGVQFIVRCITTEESTTCSTSTITL